MMSFFKPTIITFLFVVSFCEISQALTFQGNSLVESTTGYTTLSWDRLENVEFELQQSSSRLFKDIRSVYKGRDSAVFISGLKNGRYFYRVRSLKDNSLQSTWSDIKELRVVHHSLKTALSLFLLGLTTFLFTIVVIFKGHFQHQKRTFQI